MALLHLEGSARSAQVLRGAALPARLRARGVLEAARWRARTWSCAMRLETAAGKGGFLIPRC